MGAQLGAPFSSRERSGVSRKRKRGGEGRRGGFQRLLPRGVDECV